MDIQQTFLQTEGLVYYLFKIIVYSLSDIFFKPWYGLFGFDLCNKPKPQIDKLITVAYKQCWETHKC